MKYIARQQIINLFNNPQETMANGLYFSGYEGEGERKDWHTNGQLWIRCFFKNDKYEGEFKAWDSSGNLINHLLYKNDEAIKNYLK